jgi:hypothetical protein
VNKFCSIGVVLLLILVVGAYAVPTPHSILGEIFESDGSTSVPRYTPFVVNDTNSSTLFVGQTDNPVRGGLYSITIQGEDGDIIVMWAWTTTDWGNLSFVLNGNMNNVDFNLSYPRIEQNVTFDQPADNTTTYLYRLFNVSANITALGGANNRNCDITLTIGDTSVANFYGSETSQHSVSSITLGNTITEIWELNATNLGTTNFSVQSICENQTDFYNNNSDILYNITVVEAPAPYFTAIELEDDDDALLNELDLDPGIPITVWCNGTVNDQFGFSNINSVTGRIYANTSTYDSSEDNSNHYRDADCTTGLTSVNGFFSCNFSVQFFADPGNWTCEVEATNLQSSSNRTNDTSLLNEMIAININNTQLNFGNMVVGENTGSSDIIDEVANEGNVPFDVRIDTYNDTEESVSAFDCAVGRIPVQNLRVSHLPNIDVFSKLFAPASGNLFIDSNHTEQQGALATTPSIDYLYWGLVIPGKIAGVCTGNVLYIAEKST